MKRIIFSIAFLACFLTAAAQTMYIWQKGVGIAVSENLVGDMLFSADGMSFTVLGTEFNTQNIDSITFDTNTVDEQTVSLYYNAANATAVLPIGLIDTVNVVIDGAYVSATSISDGGKEISYSLSGTSDDGAFTQTGSYKCTVVLNGVNLTSKRGAAIDIQNGKRIDMILSDGTTSTLSDYAAGTQKACLYVKGHPEFSESGTLNITGNANHGFASKEYTRFKSSTGTINILSAANDGMHIGQYLKAEGGSVTVKNVGGDGVQIEHTNDASDEYNGQAMILGGSFDIAITSDDVKALRADSLMTISGGTINITSSGAGSKGIATDTDLSIDETSAPVSITIKCTGGVYTNPSDPTDTKKSQGINVNGNLTVTAGTLNISSTGTKGKAIKVDGVSKKGSAANVKTNPSYNFDFTF